MTSKLSQAPSPLTGHALHLNELDKVLWPAH